MESPNMGNVAAADRAEEMSRWGDMYEANSYNSQKWNSHNNYSDWGNAHYGESKRRPMRGKPHHNRRNHQQTAWAPEYSPAHAPASPQWQPQPPPPPETSFNGYQQEPQGSVAVNLQGLPSALCRKNFLEAMLDQAGLENDIMGCVVGEEQDTGKAVVYLANYAAAMKCVQHFGGRKWEQAGPPVTAHVAEGQCPQPANVPPANVPPASTGDAKGPRKPRGAKNVQEQMTMMPAPMPYMAAPVPWMMPQPMAPFIPIQEIQQGSTPMPQLPRDNSPKPASNGSNSPKVCWADLTDEEGKSEGVEGSTSAGSASRNSNDFAADGFFFGCDVDTDDGF